jgi:hypothetical protein
VLILMTCSSFASSFDIRSCFRRGAATSENRGHEESRHTSDMLMVSPSISAINHLTTCDTAYLTQDKPCRPTTPRKAKIVSYTPSNVVKRSTYRPARVSWSGLSFRPTTLGPTSTKFDVTQEIGGEGHKANKRTYLHRKIRGWRTLRWGSGTRQVRCIGKEYR